MASSRPPFEQAEFRSLTYEAGLGGGRFTPGVFVHGYVALDFEPRYKRATKAADARAFLRTVGRAGRVIEWVVAQSGGAVVELQGEVVHYVIPADNAQALLPESVAGDIHVALTKAGNHLSATTGWRIACERGFTLIVRGRGIHGDDSLVSIGDAANAPAKHLYRELAKPEAERDLTKWCLALRRPGSNTWAHRPLADIARARIESSSIPAIDEGDLLQGVEVRLQSPAKRRTIKMQAAPLSPVGTPSSPDTEDPEASYAWVMRADLDGFTDRVRACRDNLPALACLASDFGELMDAAAAFAQEHDVSLVQLPWAGDNFTVAAVFSTVEQYRNAQSERPVTLIADFEVEMQATVDRLDLKGWGYSTAGGDVHGNAIGNFFLGSVAFEARRFLVAGGLGVGRSQQALNEIETDVTEVTAFHEDVDALAQNYREAFKPCQNASKATSTLFAQATLDTLERAEVRTRTDRPGKIRIEAAAGVPVTVLPVRPYGSLHETG